MRLQHLHLPGLIRYPQAAKIQDHLFRTLLAFKDKSNVKASPLAAIPNPTVITAQFQPVYTCGRREISQLSEDEKQYLRRDGRAEFHEALRGGQTTFHGPGQLVAYPVLDLKGHFTSATGSSKPLAPRDYVCKLEESVIRTLAHYGIHSFRTENPGVWTSEESKICALGIHMRRNVTSHGIGLNICTDLEWFARIVACGLVGKESSSMKKMHVHLGSEAKDGRNDPAVEEVGETFVTYFNHVFFGGNLEIITVHEQLAVDELDH